MLKARYIVVNNPPCGLELEEEYMRRLSWDSVEIPIHFLNTLSSKARAKGVIATCYDEVRWSAHIGGL